MTQVSRRIHEEPVQKVVSLVVTILNAIVYLLPGLPLLALITNPSLMDSVEG
jgi:hypothetical protein